MAANYLLVTGHDYRSKRKANVHYIADELRVRGKLRFLSVGYSPLSDMRGRDPRTGQGIAENVVETKNGVDCYLWKTAVHPFNPKIPAAYPLSRALFELYARHRPKLFDTWVRESDTILIESGLPVIFIKHFAAVNPKARIIYIASDDMETISCDPYLNAALAESAHLISGARLPSRLLANNMPRNLRAHYIPHGMDPNISATPSPSPYDPGSINAVSVGSMLFDPSFFSYGRALIS